MKGRVGVRKRLLQAGSVDSDGSEGDRASDAPAGAAAAASSASSRSLCTRVAAPAEQAPRCSFFTKSDTFGGDRFLICFTLKIYNSRVVAHSVVAV